MTDMVENQLLKSRFKGDFTLLKFISRLSLAALEDAVGFHKGRLTDKGKGGCALILLPPAIDLTPADFEFGASTRWSRESMAVDVKWVPLFMAQSNGQMKSNAIEAVIEARGNDVEALKTKVIGFFRTKMDHWPAKVIPFWEHEQGMAYPNAMPAGIPQFKMTKPKDGLVYRIVR